MADVFISYSRKDKDFVRVLHESLTRLERNTWVDWQGIPPTANWLAEIYSAIEAAESFAFIISPNSVSSEVCGLEVAHAVKHNKRLLPIVYCEADAKAIPPALTALNWLFFREGDDFEVALQKLIQAMDLDLEHLKTHTRLLLRTNEWHKKGSDNSFLLRGSDLTESEQWLAQAANKDPKPTEFQSQYLLASQQWQRQESQRWKELYEVAEQERARADLRRIQAERSEIKALCKSAEALFASGQVFDALLEGLRAGIKLKQADWFSIETEIQTQVTASLQQALCAVKEQNRLEGHLSTVWSISFSPDGQTIVSGSSDGTVKLWKIDGTLLSTLREATTCINTVRFSPDGQQLAASCEDQTVKLWSLDGTLVKVFSGHNADVACLSFSPDGQTIASISYDGILQVWQLDGTVIHSFAAHSAGGQIVSFSSDGQFLASGSNSPIENTLKFWHRDGRLLQTIQLDSGVISSSAHPTNQSVAVVDATDVKLFNLNGSLLQTFKGHQQRVTCVCFSADGQYLASGDSDGIIKIWTPDGSPLRTLQQPSSLAALSLSPDGQMLATTGQDGIIRLWQWDSPLSRTFSGQGNQRFHGIRFSPDGQTFITGSSDQTVKLWSQQGKLLKALEGHQGQVWRTCYSLDGQLIASGSSDNTAKIWSHDGTLLETLFHGTVVWDVSFSPSGQLLATAGSDDTLKLWKIDGTLQRTMGNGKGEQFNYSVCFSPDNKLIASGRSDRTIQLWDIEGNLHQTFEGHDRAVVGLCFSPDGQTLISCSRDNTVRVWTLDGKVIKTLRGHRNFVWDVSLSPDGQTIASASWDQTIKLWRIDGTLLVTLQGHTDDVWGVSFSPDGQTLASTSRDKTVMLWNWNLSFDEMLKSGCQWICNYLKTNPNVEESDRQIGNNLSVEHRS